MIVEFDNLRIFFIHGPENVVYFFQNAKACFRANIVTNQHLFFQATIHSNSTNVLYSLY